MPCELDYISGVFIGQHIDGKPHGIIRFIDQFYNIYEGEVFKGKKNGWGRYFIRHYTTVGWWKDGKQNGNCRSYYQGKVDEEGWFEDHSRKGTFKKDSMSYPYWTEEIYNMDDY